MQTKRLQKFNIYVIIPLNNVFRGDVNMDIAKEMLANKLAEVIKENIDSFELDAEGEAVKALSEIREVINDIAPDEETVLKIAWILKRHGIDTAATTDMLYNLKKAENRINREMKGVFYK